MKDKISALMDNEIELDGYEYLLTASKSEGELNECWATYHLIGDVLRGNPVLSRDTKANIMAKLENEATVLAPKAKKSVFKPAYMSVAASFAAFFFVALMVLNHQVPDTRELQPAVMAQSIPSEYLLAHQASAPSNVAYYIQPASYVEDSK